MATARAQVPTRRGGSADDLSQDMAEILAAPMVKGTLLKDIKVGTGATRVPHGLNRVPTSWVACNARDAFGVVAQNSGASPDDRNLYLIASAAVTVDIWVFG